MPRRSWAFRATAWASRSKRVLAGLTDKLLAPALVAVFIAEFERELKIAQRQAAETTRELRARLQACERQIENIVAVVTEGR